MKRVIVLSALVAASAPSLAAAHPSIPSVFAKLGRVHTIGAVAISPDGTMLAWSEAIEAKRGKKTVSSDAIYVAPSGDASAAKRIAGCMGGRCDDADFAWSPNSKRLAFLRTTAGQAELIVATPASGAVRQVTSHSQGPLTTPRWSPDGRQIAVLYTKGAPKAPGPLNPLARDAGVLGSVVHEQRIAVTSPGGAPLRLVSPADLYVYEYDWSPHGTTFAASAAHGSGDDNWWVANLYTIAVGSGRTKLIHHPALQMASPRWSGDGKRIAYIGGLMSDESITGGDCYVVPAGGGAAVDVTPNAKASVTTIAWNGSTSRLLLTYLQGGRMGVAMVDADTKVARSRWSAQEMIFGIASAASSPAIRASPSRRTARARRSCGSRSRSPPRSGSARSGRGDPSPRATPRRRTSSRARAASRGRATASRRRAGCCTRTATPLTRNTRWSS